MFHLTSASCLSPCLPSSRSGPPTFGKILRTVVVKNGSASARQAYINQIRKPDIYAPQVKTTHIKSAGKSVNQDMLVYHDQEPEPVIQALRQQLGNPVSWQTLSQNQFQQACRIIKKNSPEYSEQKLPKSTSQKVKTGLFGVVNCITDAMLYGSMFTALAGILSL